jgi:hypothetical protein
MLVTAPVRGRQRRNDVVVNTVARRLVAPYQEKLGCWHEPVRNPAGDVQAIRPERGRSDQLASPVTSKHRDFREERSANLRAFEQLALSIGGLPQAELGRGS